MTATSPQSDGRDGDDGAPDDATVVPNPADSVRDAGRVSPTPRPESVSLAQSLPQAPPVEVPNHTLVRCLGVGGFGQVWLGKHLLTDHYRACKLFHLDRARELEGLKRIKRDVATHPGLVPIEEVGVQGEWLYCLMPLADSARVGQAIHEPAQYLPATLRLHLRRHGRLPPDEALVVARELAEAIVHLHRHGVTHGDIKPANVLRLNGRWALADYGLADDLDAGFGGGGFGDGGTPGYLPPEGPGSPKADQYAFGVLMREIVDDETPSTVATALVRIAARATAQRADERFASVAEVVTALSAIGSAADSAAGQTDRRNVGAVVEPPSPPALPGAAAVRSFRDALLDFWVAVRHGGEIPESWRRRGAPISDEATTATPADAESIACADCGYALRGLPPDGRCPECALSVSESMRAAGLWTTRRLKLLVLACAGLIAMLPAWLVVAILPLAVPVPNTVARLLVAGGIVVYAVLLVVIAVASVHAASRRARAIRYGLVATVCVIGVLPVALVVAQIIRPWFINDTAGAVILATMFFSRIALLAITLFGLRSAADALRAPGAVGWMIAAVLTLLTVLPWAYVTLAPAMRQSPLQAERLASGIMLTEAVLHGFVIVLAVPLMMAARRRLV